MEELRNVVMDSDEGEEVKMVKVREIQESIQAKSQTR